jgi:hypothetical protein
MARSDNFNRADTGAGGLGTPSDGGSAWNDRSSVFQISSNKAKSTGGAQALAVLTDTLSNVELNVTCVTGASSDIWIPFRFVDDGNYWIAVVGSGDGPRLFKRVSGGFTQVGSTGSGTLAAGTHLITVEANGNSIELLVNGVSKVGPITDSFQSTAVAHGIGSNSDTTTTFEDFSTVAAGGYVITLDPGSYSISGQAVTTLATRLVALNSSSYSWAGQAVTLTYEQPGVTVLALDPGSYVFSGSNVLRAISFAANSGSYTISGQDLNFTRTFPQAYSITIENAAYNMTGRAIALRWSGEPVSDFISNKISISIGARVG